MYLIIFVIFVTYVVYLILRNYAHLKEAPMPPCNLLLGHIPDFLKREDILARFTKYIIQCGKIFRVYLPLRRPVLVIADHSLIQIITTSKYAMDKGRDYLFLRRWLGKGLLTTDSEFYKANRKMLTPCFGRHSLMVNFVPIFESNGDKLVDILKEQIRNKDIDIFPIVKMFTMNVMCESSLGGSNLKCYDYIQKYFKCVETLQDINANRVFSPIKRTDFLYQFTNDYKREREALKTVDEYLDIIINQSLLDEKDKTETDKDEMGTTFLKMLLEWKSKNGLTKDYIRDEVNTFLFGGHDTTATGIAFTLYALARNPDIQEKILAEQSDIFGRFDKNCQVSYSELKQMKYLELVINESLRMYPPIPFLGRKMKTDFQIGPCVVPKNYNVGIFIYGCHHNPEYFPEPEKFIPERFLDNKKPIGFMPFSNGPRNCIGNKFALLQMKSCISKVVRKFKLMPPEPDYKIEIIPKMTLVSRNGIRISVERRLSFYE